MMLSRELLDIIKKQSFEIFVDSVGVSVFISLVKKLDSEFNLYPCSISNAIFLSLLHAQDDVYTWAVELASFDPESNLYKVPLLSISGGWMLISDESLSFLDCLFSIILIILAGLL